MTVSTLKSFLAAFNAHDLDAIMGFFAEDCEFYMPRGTEAWGTRYVGKRAVREGLATRFAGIPDVHHGDDNHWLAGNPGVSTLLLTGTTTTDQAIRVRGVGPYRVSRWEDRQEGLLWKIGQK